MVRHRLGRPWSVLVLLCGTVACSGSSSEDTACAGPCPDGQQCGVDGVCHPNDTNDGGMGGTTEAGQLPDASKLPPQDAAGDTGSEASLLDSNTDSAADSGTATNDASDSATSTDSASDSATDSASDSATTTDGAVDSGPPGPYELYVKTTGLDTNDGKTPATAVKTLARVQEILVAAHPDRDVEVRIEQGTYQGQSVSWTYYNPSHKIAFMPIDYHGGGVGSIAGLPVFDGQGAGALLGLHASDGKPTRLEFYYLQIQGYQKFGLLFGGNRNDFDHGWNGYNKVYGCRLTKIGSYDNPGANGYGALDLVNSRHNEIRNNHFVNVRNASGGEGLMHGVYLAHGSSDNNVTANKFTNISGDPIRVRDESNRNYVADNVFTNTGSDAFISDWWCDKSQTSACTKPSGECPSWENNFRTNEVHCGYGGKKISLFKYFQGVSYVPSWCVDHATQDGWKRLHTSGNQGTCP